jgi:hypothetical protein
VVESRAADRLVERGRFEAAARHYARSIDAAAEAGSPEGQFLATVDLADLYATYPSLGREEESIDLWLEALELAEQTYGLTSHNLGLVALRLADTLVLLDRSAEAVPYFEGAVAVFDVAHGTDDPSTENARAKLATARQHAGDEIPESELARRVRAASASLMEDAIPAFTSEEDAALTAQRSTRPLIDSRKTYLRWNAQDVDGTWAFVHVTPDDMPLRVAIGRPRVGARDGSTEDARLAAIEGMQLWERALSPWLPWFELEFVKRDPEAAVQFVWKRRMVGDAAGRGGIRFEVRDGRLRVGGQLQVTMQPYLPWEVPLELDKLRRLVAHEFGHVLGLGHCLDCESVMNYSWETLERVFVTDLDVLTFRALVERPNGVRRDGQPLSGLAPSEERHRSASGLRQRTRPW